jgi:hypothetical protein
VTCDAMWAALATRRVTSREAGYCRSQRDIASTISTIGEMLQVVETLMANDDTYKIQQALAFKHYSLVNNSEERHPVYEVHPIYMSPEIS